VIAGARLAELVILNEGQIPVRDRNEILSVPHTALGATGERNRVENETRVVWEIIANVAAGSTLYSEVKA
jgi:hypothetical protein